MPPSSWSVTSSCCWSTGAPSRRRRCAPGGLGVRELKTAAELLHVEERVAALHVETAPLPPVSLDVGSTDDQDAAWLPTDAFDVWLAASPADRWTRLALAWLDSPRLVGLIGTRAAGKPVNALAPDLERAWLPETRRSALVEVAALPAGEVLAAGTGICRPWSIGSAGTGRAGRPPRAREAVAWAMEEAAVVGVIGPRRLSPRTGGRCSPTRIPPTTPRRRSSRCCPSPWTTCCCRPTSRPWPRARSSSELGHHLATLADIESRGGATVYRFTERSVRRGFDSGWSAGRGARASRRVVAHPGPAALVVSGR